MKRIVLSILLLIATGCVLKTGTDPSGEAAHQEAISVAEKSAAQWFAWLDAGKSEECWKGAAPTFRRIIPLEKWAVVVSAVRRSLGPVVARRLKEASYNPASVLRSQPDSIVFKTRVLFAGNRVAEETLILVLAKDGEWSVAEANFRGINFGWAFRMSL